MADWIAAAALTLLVLGAAFILRTLLVLSRRAERIEASLVSATDLLGGINHRLSKELDREASEARRTTAPRAARPSGARRQVTTGAKATPQAQPYAPTADEEAGQEAREASPPPGPDDRVSQQPALGGGTSPQGAVDHKGALSNEDGPASAESPINADAEADSSSTELSKKTAIELFRRFRKTAELDVPGIDLMRMNWIGHVAGRLGESLGSFRVVQQVGDFLAVRRGNRAFVFPNPEVGDSAPDQDLVFPGYREGVSLGSDGLVDPPLVMARNDGTWVTVNE